MFYGKKNLEKISSFDDSKYPFFFSRKKQLRLKSMLKKKSKN